MDRFTRIVLGYHGCEPTFAAALVQGDVALGAWEPMSDDFIVQRLRAAIQSIEEETPEEFFADLQRAGIIDEEGRVLKRAPEPPKDAAANGTQKKVRTLTQAWSPAPFQLLTRTPPWIANAEGIHR
jgi:hypothetical protein